MVKSWLKLLALAGFAISAPPALSEPFEFVVVGDQPYGIGTKIKNRYLSLIEEINQHTPAMVIHVGDTKSGGTLCSNALLTERLEYLNLFTAPTLYSPGDNEWTDCYRLSAGAYDPQERLAYIRETYFQDPSTSFGQNPMALSHQGAEGYPENARVMMNEVMFITAHVVGSNNNFEATRPEAAVEFAARDAANRQWLVDSFTAAKSANAKAIVLAIHADMFEFGFGPSWSAESFLRHSGFGPFAKALIWQAGEFGGQVLLVYGDSHKFRMFRPFPQNAPNVMALETFGDKNMHAVRVHVTPEDRFPFAIQPLVNPEQPLTRKKN